MAIPISGVIPALVTPRSADDDTVDTERLRALTVWLMNAGVHGLFPCSSTGEAPLLSWKSRCLVIETVAETVNGTMPVLAGVGAASTAESLRLTRDAQEAGATHLAVLPLHFIRLTQDELYGYFAAVADSSDLPTLLYNFPPRTSGQNIAPETAARLAQSHNVIGVKDSGGDLENTCAYLDACGPDFAVFTGYESQVTALVRAGGAGTVCAGANVFPRELVALYEAASTGRWVDADHLQQALMPWRDLVALGTFPASVKAALAAIGQPVGPPFLPVHPLDSAQTAELRNILAQLPHGETSV